MRMKDEPKARSECQDIDQNRSALRQEGKKHSQLI